MKILGAVLAAAALAFILPVLGSAQADTGSTCPADGPCAGVPGYLRQLGIVGISGNSDQTLINNGQKICGDIAHSTPSELEAAGLRQTNPSLSHYQAATAVDAALTYLCPQLVNWNTSEPLLPLD